MQLEDAASSYGWVSIALHWTTGVIIMVMLVVGSLAAASAQTDWEQMLAMHTTIGVLAYPLLWARIIWRLFKGHPGPLPTQSPFFHLIGRITHYAMIGAIGVMLISGPLTVWSAGYPVVVLGHTLIQNAETNMDLFQTARLLHHTVGLALLLLVILHIAAAIKHMAINRDGTIDKIIIPKCDEASAKHNVSA